MRPKLNLEHKGQISKPNEYTVNFKSNLTYIFLSVRAKLKKPLCPRTLCTTNNNSRSRLEKILKQNTIDTEKCKKTVQPN